MCPPGIMRVAIARVGTVSSKSLLALSVCNSDWILHFDEGSTSLSELEACYTGKS